jgi:hypothetical protein
MRSFWRAVVRTIFWSYDRGSWPYDVLVVAIVIFVLASPRSWFHDRPQSGAAASTSVQFIAEDSGSETRVYRLDATIFSPQKRASKPTPELERETHDILGRSVGDLRDRAFQVVRIDPVLDGDGAVLLYDVTIHLSGEM